MSLTTGRGPLSAHPAGRFDPPLPAGPTYTYVEPFRRRVRARLGDRTVVDSERVLLVHRAGQAPSYAFPASDVVEAAAAGLAAPDEPAAPGYVRIAWDAVDSWLEEDEEVYMHPRNPYHRIDCVRTSRQLRVSLPGGAGLAGRAGGAGGAGSVVLVDTTRTLGLYETALDPRLYVSRDQVRMDLLRPSRTTTYCPYKGTASYFDAVVEGVTVPDVAWSYEAPLPESVPIRGMLAFDPARAVVEQDLPPGV